METNKDESKILLPHHVQQKLCNTRLPYRQGRKLTAVKVYTVAKESNHLLIFGVPSLNLGRETKALFMKFGRMLQFNISKEHSAEPFTETYHSQYESIHSARVAKRMLDSKNFYGGLLHVCYAPEFESINETYQKLVHRQKDVLNRLKNLHSEEKIFKEETISKNINSSIQERSANNEKSMLNMGEINFITITNEVTKSKRKISSGVVKEKRFKPCFLTRGCDERVIDNVKLVSSNVKRSSADVTEVEVVDCTSVDKTTVSNINEALNYKQFGNEVVFKLPNKPANKITFNINKTSLVYGIFYLKFCNKYK